MHLKAREGKPETRRIMLTAVIDAAAVIIEAQDKE